MKSLTAIFVFALVLVLILAANPVFAGEIGYDDNSVQTQYISWCQNSNVVGYNSSQQVEIKFDCAETQKTCEQQELYRGGRVLVVAACSAK